MEDEIWYVDLVGSHKSVFLGFQLFISVHSFTALKYGFWVGFLKFWICSSHISPPPLPIELASWNGVCGFSTDRRYLQSCTAYPKITSLDQLGGEIWGGFPFLTFKKTILPLSPLQIKLENLNLVCRFSRSPRCAFWRSQLFSFIAPLSPQCYKNLGFCFFWTWFLT